MQVNPYLFFNGNCEAALKFYQKVLGAKIEAMLPYSTGPADMPVPPEWKDKVLHASIPTILLQKNALISYTRSRLTPTLASLRTA